MRNKIKKMVDDTVYEASVYLLTHKIPIDANLNYFVDDIFLSAIQKLSHHFLNEENLRDSEKLTLIALTSSCNNGDTLTNIKRNLIKNLNNIKPKWGVLFGGNRGDVFHAFRYLLQWPCFSDAFRTRMKAKEIQALKEHLHSQELEITESASHLEEAGESLKTNETITRKTAQRATSQFIQIQALIMENKTLKLKLKAAEQSLSSTTKSQAPPSSEPQPPQ